MLARWTRAGRVTVRFIIVGDGTVAMAEVVESSTTLGDPTTERCVSHAVRRLVFPAPDGGGIVIVTYPFAFDTDPPVPRDAPDGGSP